MLFIDLYIIFCLFLGVGLELSIENLIFKKFLACNISALHVFKFFIALYLIVLSHMILGIDIVCVILSSSVPDPQVLH